MGISLARTRRRPQAAGGLLHEGRERARTIVERAEISDQARSAMARLDDLAHDAEPHLRRGGDAMRTAVTAAAPAAAVAVMARRRRPERRRRRRGAIVTVLVIAIAVAGWLLWRSRRDSEHARLVPEPERPDVAPVGSSDPAPAAPQPDREPVGDLPMPDLGDAPAGDAHEEVGTGDTDDVDGGATDEPAREAPLEVPAEPQTERHPITATTDPAPEIPALTRPSWPAGIPRPGTIAPPPFTPASTRLPSRGGFRLP